MGARKVLRPMWMTLAFVLVIHARRRCRRVITAQSTCASELALAGELRFLRGPQRAEGKTCETILFCFLAEKTASGLDFPSAGIISARCYAKHGRPHSQSRADILWCCASFVYQSSCLFHFFVYFFCFLSLEVCAAMTLAFLRPSCSLALFVVVAVGKLAGAIDRLPTARL